MSDRYDDVMTSLYTGAVPDWLPPAKRTLFVRESMRRRCELGAQLKASWPCTMFYARCTVSEDFALSVYDQWPDACRAAQDVTTGLHVGLGRAIEAAGTPRALWELFQYETLNVALGSCEIAVPRVSPQLVTAAGLAGCEVFRFALRVPELWSRMKLYHSSLAPARFVREYEVVQSPTYVGRARRGDRWVLDDVSEAFAIDLG
jgi:hypothetical protein